MKQEERKWKRLNRFIERKKPTRLQDMVAFALSAPACYTRDAQNSIVPAETGDEMRFVDKRGPHGGIDWDSVSCTMSREEWGAYAMEGVGA